MSDATYSSGGLRNWISRVFQRPHQQLTLLGLPSPPPRQRQTQPPPPPQPAKSSSSPESIPGNYYFFKSAIQIELRGQTFVAVPAVAIWEGRPPRTRWATMTDPAYYGLERNTETMTDPGFGLPRILWMDESDRGVSARTIKRPEDMLGVEGRMFDDQALFRFEEILSSVKHWVAFAIYCPSKNIRLAYGFPREMFPEPDASFALKKD